MDIDVSFIVLDGYICNFEIYKDIDVIFKVSKDIDEIFPKNNHAGISRTSPCNPMVNFRLLR